MTDPRGQALPALDPLSGRTWIYPTNRKHPVRDYQLEICKQALFTNTLVCLPTGLGKTLIAAVVMYNFYRWFPEGRVIFMAPTRPLVAQQCTACKEIMGIPEHHTAVLEGTVSAERRTFLYTQRRMIFCTPQTLLNDLHQGRLPASRIVCLVFDEAHRASNNYAYSQVMRELQAHISHCRVLALTATPGSDMKRVQAVINNLCLAHIEIRTEDDPALAPYTFARQVEVLRCKGSPSTSLQAYLKSELNGVMQSYVDQLHDQGWLQSKQVAHVSQFVVDEIEQDVSSAGCRDGLQLPSLLNCVQCLKMLLQVKRILHQDQDVPGCWRFLHNALLSYPDRCTEELQSLEQLLDKAGRDPAYVMKRLPKIEALQGLLSECFQAPKRPSDAAPHSPAPSNHSAPPESRILIFVHYRSTVHEILHALKDVPGVRAKEFVGQRAAEGSAVLSPLRPPTNSHSSSDSPSSGTVSSSSSSHRSSGLRQAEQMEILQSFNRGDYNVLVATSIAEEGLDISEVDMIILFDSVSSPVRYIQQCGRTGRHKQGRIVILSTAAEKDASEKTSDPLSDWVSPFSPSSPMSPGGELSLQEKHRRRVLAGDLMGEEEERIEQNRESVGKLSQLLKAAAYNLRLSPHSARMLVEESGALPDVVFQEMVAPGAEASSKGGGDEATEQRRMQSVDGRAKEALSPLSTSPLSRTVVTNPRADPVVLGGTSANSRSVEMFDWAQAEVEEASGAATNDGKDEEEDDYDDADLFAFEVVATPSPHPGKLADTPKSDRAVVENKPPTQIPAGKEQTIEKAMSNDAIQPIHAFPTDQAPPPVTSASVPTVSTASYVSAAPAVPPPSKPEQLVSQGVTMVVASSSSKGGSGVGKPVLQTVMKLSTTAGKATTIPKNATFSTRISSSAQVARARPIPTITKAVVSMVNKAPPPSSTSSADALSSSASSASSASSVSSSVGNALVEEAEAPPLFSPPLSSTASSAAANEQEPAFPVCQESEEAKPAEKPTEDMLQLDEFSFCYTATGISLTAPSQTVPSSANSTGAFPIVAQLPSNSAPASGMEENSKELLDPNRSSLQENPPRQTLSVADAVNTMSTPPQPTSCTFSSAAAATASASASASASATTTSTTTVSMAATTTVALARTIASAPTEPEAAKKEKKSLKSVKILSSSMRTQPVEDASSHSSKKMGRLQGLAKLGSSSRKDVNDFLACDDEGWTDPTWRSALPLRSSSTPSQLPSSSMNPISKPAQANAAPGSTAVGRTGSAPKIAAASSALNQQTSSYLSVHRPVEPALPEPSSKMIEDSPEVVKRAHSTAAKARGRALWQEDDFSPATKSPAQKELVCYDFETLHARQDALRSGVNGQCAICLEMYEDGDDAVEVINIASDQEDGSVWSCSSDSSKFTRNRNCSKASSSSAKIDRGRGSKKLPSVVWLQCRWCHSFCHADCYGLESLALLYIKSAANLQYSSAGEGDENCTLRFSCEGCQFLERLSPGKLSTPLPQFKLLQQLESKESQGKLCCILCQQSGGLMKQVAPSSGNLQYITQHLASSFLPSMTSVLPSNPSPYYFVHSLCVLFTPELTMNQDMRCDNVQCLDVQRSSLLCKVCRQRKGNIVQCHHPQCFAGFHPYCAMKSGHLLVIAETSRRGSQEIEYRLYCPEHEASAQTLHHNILSSSRPMPGTDRRSNNSNASACVSGTNRVDKGCNEGGKLKDRQYSMGRAKNSLPSSSAKVVFLQSDDESEEKKKAADDYFGEGEDLEVIEIDADEKDGKDEEEEEEEEEEDNLLQATQFVPPSKKRRKRLRKAIQYDSEGDEDDVENVESDKEIDEDNDLDQASSQEEIGRGRQKGASRRDEDESTRRQRRDDFKRRRVGARKFFELEAEISGSDSGDEEDLGRSTQSSEEALSGDFINDDELTPQDHTPSSKALDGPSFYHAVNQQQREAEPLTQAVMDEIDFYSLINRRRRDERSLAVIDTPERERREQLSNNRFPMGNAHAVQPQAHERTYGERVGPQSGRVGGYGWMQQSYSASTGSTNRTNWGASRPPLSTPYSSNAHAPPVPRPPAPPAPVPGMHPYSNPSGAVQPRAGAGGDTRNPPNPAQGSFLSMLHSTRSSANSTSSGDANDFLGDEAW